MKERAPPTIFGYAPDERSLGALRALGIVPGLENIYKTVFSERTRSTQFGRFQSEPGQRTLHERFSQTSREYIAAIEDPDRHMPVNPVVVEEHANKLFWREEELIHLIGETQRYATVMYERQLVDRDVAAKERIADLRAVIETRLHDYTVIITRMNFHVRQFDSMRHETHQDRVRLQYLLQHLEPNFDSRSYDPTREKRND